MPYATTAKNSMLNALTIDRVSLHTAYGADQAAAIASEVAGGAYARQAITVDAAAGGARSQSGAAPVFTMPVVSGVAFVGHWSNAGPTFHGMSPLGSGTPIPFMMADAVADALVAPAHGLANNDRVVAWALAGLALPTGLTEGTIYWVVNASADDFQLSATQGGAAIALTAVGRGLVQRVVPRDIVQAGDTITLTDSDLDLNL